MNMFLICFLFLLIKVEVNILLYNDPYHWTTFALHCWQLAGKTKVCSVYGAAGSPAYYSLAPQVHGRTLTPFLTKLVLIYRHQKGGRLSWPEQMRVNNLPKVITRQPSDTTGIRTWATRSWNRCGNHLATAPPMCILPSISINIDC